MKSQTAFSRLESRTNHVWFSALLTVLRIGVGIQFFHAGVTKFGGWSAEGYLNGASGPFTGFFHSLAGNPVVDQLNIWGLTLIGVALILGLAVRSASFFGIMMMALYYLAQFDQNTAHGLIEQHVILIFVFLLFMGGGVGHTYGLDTIAHGYLPKKQRLANLLFG